MTVFKKTAYEVGRGHKQTPKGKVPTADYLVEWRLFGVRVWYTMHRGVLPGEAYQELKVDNIIRE